MTVKYSSVDFLILGAGWTSTFLLPLLQSREIKHAATTTTGHSVNDIPTIPFKFDPDSASSEPYKSLPRATTVLITFPLKGHGQSSHLVKLYNEVHEGGDARHWIQLGETGIWKGDGWHNTYSEIDTSNARAIAEIELLKIGGSCVLNLAGLWGGERVPTKWVSRVASSKEDVKRKGGLHMVHGEDVARAIVACYEKWEKVEGGRWLLNDLRCYDWWNLIMAWGGDGKEYRKWVLELMDEQGVKALPRDIEKLSRFLDGRDFWREVDLQPTKSLMI